MFFGVGTDSSTDGYFCWNSANPETKHMPLQLASATTTEIKLTQFLHFLFELQTPAPEDVGAHGHREHVVGEFSASVAMLHFVVAELLEGFVGSDDLVEQTAQGEFLSSLCFFRFVEPVDGGGGDAESRRVETWSN